MGLSRTISELNDDFGQIANFFVTLVGLFKLPSVEDLTDGSLYPSALNTRLHSPTSTS